MFRAYDGNHAPKGPIVLNRASPQSRGLALWYPLQDDDSTRVRDYSGSGFDGVNQGTYRSETGDFNTKRRRFEELSVDYIDIPNKQDIEYPFIGLSVWVRWADNTTDDEYVFSPGKNFSNGEGLHLRRSRFTTHGINCFAFTATGNVNVEIQTSFQPTGGQLYHVVCSYAEDAKLRMWVDGVLIGTSAASGNGLFYDAGGTAQIASTFVAGQGTLEGTLFDFKLYKRGLYEADVQLLYAPQTRWDLYEQSLRRNYFVPVAIVGGGFARMIFLTGEM